MICLTKAHTGGIKNNKKLCPVLFLTESIILNQLLHIFAAEKIFIQKL